MVENTNPESYASKFPGVPLKIPGRRPGIFHKFEQNFGQAEGLGPLSDREAIAAC